MDELAKARAAKKRPTKVPVIATHEEVMALLTEQARAGSVTAAAALERALRAVAKHESESFDDQLDRILTK